MESSGSLTKFISSLNPLKNALFYHQFLVFFWRIIKTFSFCFCLSNINAIYISTMTQSCIKCSMTVIGN